MTVILLIEDNPDIMKINASALKMRGYEVLCAETAEKGRDLLARRDVDLIVLDIMLPDSNGIDLCSELKKTRNIPILFLSALRKNADIVAGLRAGGDDYLTKPYDLEVFIARVEARLRSGAAPAQYLYFGALKLDTLSLAGILDGEDLLLTPKEFSVLLLLVKNANSIVDKEKIYSVVWGQSMNRDSHALWTVISRLNKKLRSEQTGITISPHRSKGYILEKNRIS